MSRDKKVYTAEEMLKLNEQYAGKVFDVGRPIHCNPWYHHLYRFYTVDGNLNVQHFSLYDERGEMDFFSFESCNVYHLDAIIEQVVEHGTEISKEKLDERLATAIAYITSLREPPTHKKQYDGTTTT